MQKTVSRLLRVDSIPVRVFEEGAGEPIVFLHGFCLHSQIWEQIFEDLRHDFKLIAIDLPGHGETGMVPGMHSIDELARWLNKVIRQLELEKFTLIGHSLGGYIAVAYADLYRSKVKGLGLIHSLASSDPPMRQEGRNKILRFIEKNGISPFLQNFYPTLYRDLHPEIHEHFIEMTMIEPRPEAVVAMTVAMRDRQDRLEVLRSLKIPVLFVIGGQDEFIPRTHSREETIAAQFGITAFIEECCHLAMLEEPSKTITAIRSLMEGVKRVGISR